MRPPRQTGNVINQVSIEMVPDIVVRIAIISVEVRAVLRQCANILRYFIKAMRVSVVELRHQAMPARRAQGGLQPVVAGSADPLNFVDNSEVGKLGEVWTARLLERENIAIGGYHL